MERGVGSGGERDEHLLDDLPVGIYRTTPDGAVLFANATFARLLGYDDVDVLLAEDVDTWYVDPKDRADWMAEMDAKDTVHGFETRLKRRDGTVIWVRDTATAVRGEDGSVAFYRGVIEDITEQRRVEAALDESRRRLKAVVDSAPVVLYALDDRGQITVLEGQGLAELGMSSGELVGRSVYEVYRFMPVVVKNFRRALRGESFSAVEEVEGLRYNVRYSPVEGPDGQVTGVIGVAADVTDQHNAEEGRRVALAKLAALEHVEAMHVFKTKLLNAASHELNTPITPIKIQLHVLESAEALDERQQRALSVLKRNVERLASTVQNILDVARLETGELDMHATPADLSVLVADTADEYGDLAKQAGVELHVTTEGELPVQVDSRRIDQVLFNLVSNAIKFTPRGGRVDVSAQRDGDDVLIQVRDTGVGVPREALPGLFEPLKSHEGRNGAGPSGTGVGLYVCKAIVENHGGHIWCESDGQNGSLFSFTVPLSTANVVDADRAPEAAADTAEDVSPHGIERR